MAIRTIYTISWQIHDQWMCSIMNSGITHKTFPFECIIFIASWCMTNPFINNNLRFIRSRMIACEYQPNIYFDRSINFSQRSVFIDEITTQVYLLRLLTFSLLATKNWTDGTAFSGLSPFDITQRYCEKGFDLFHMITVKCLKFSNDFIRGISLRFNEIAMIEDRKRKWIILQSKYMGSFFLAYSLKQLFSNTISIYVVSNAFDFGAIQTFRYVICFYDILHRTLAAKKSLIQFVNLHTKRIGWSQILSCYSEIFPIVSKRIC